jgi:hypothetical protein
LLPKKTNPPRQKDKAGQQNNWHWLIKHPVEFSKNNHTPELNPARRPALGQPLQPTWSISPAQDLSLRRSKSISTGIAQVFARTDQPPEVDLMIRLGLADRPMIAERPIRPAPAGWFTLPGPFRWRKSGFPSRSGPSRRSDQA